MYVAGLRTGGSLYESSSIGTVYPASRHQLWLGNQIIKNETYEIKKGGVPTARAWSDTHVRGASVAKLGVHAAGHMGNFGVAGIFRVKDRQWGRQAAAAALP